MNVTLINVSDCEINYNWSLIYETWQGHLLSLWEFGVWLNGPSSQVCLLSKQHLVLQSALIACHANIYSLVLSCQSVDRCRLHANPGEWCWHFSSLQMWSRCVNALMQLIVINRVNIGYLLYFWVKKCLGFFFADFILIFHVPVWVQRLQ